MDAVVSPLAPFSFEKVIIVNSIMLIGEAVVGLWVTSHNLEAHHYLIDTSFLVSAALLSLAINSILLRASFRPLHSLLATIRNVSAGKREARADSISADTDIGELAQAFNVMLDRLEEIQREQAMRILQAQEEERRRLALELHDETGQNLTALLVHTEVLHQRLHSLASSAIAQEARQQVADGLQQLVELTQHTLETIRTLAQQLRPSVLDDLGLLAALHWLVEDSAQRLHLRVELSIEGKQEQWQHLPPMYETTLFRIAQESLTNVARHAHTEHAWLTLSQDNRAICLCIRDVGLGYGPAQQTRLGIFGMRERAALLGGLLTISSQPAHGTTVMAQIPLPALVHKEGNNGE